MILLMVILRMWCFPGVFIITTITQQAMVNNFMIPIPLRNTDSLQTAAEPLLTTVLQHLSWAWACMRTVFNQRTKWGRLSMTTRRPRKTTSRNKCTCIRAIYMAQSGSNISCVSQCFLQSTYPPLLPVSAAWPHLHIFLAVCQPDLVVLGPYGLRYQENLAYCLVLKLSSLSQIYGFGRVIEKREMQALWVLLDAVQPPPPQSKAIWGATWEQICSYFKDRPKYPTTTLSPRYSLAGFELQTSRDCAASGD